jgi:hypothetical protein
VGAEHAARRSSAASTQARSEAAAATLGLDRSKAPRPKSKLHDPTCHWMRTAGGVSYWEHMRKIPIFILPSVSSETRQRDSLSSVSSGH